MNKYGLICDGNNPQLFGLQLFTDKITFY